MNHCDNMLQIHVKSSFSLSGTSKNNGIENIKSSASLSGSHSMNVEKYNKIHLDDGSDDGHYAKVSYIN